MIYGPNYVIREWRIKYNDELHRIFKESSVVRPIKINRLKWLGHIRRMAEEEVKKKFTFFRLERKTKIKVAG
jgi:hypothetical protein